MTKVYLIRHAEAEGNYYRRIQGHWDGRITALGMRQIDALAERMKDVHIDALYSSDLSRTKTTAQAILKYHDLELHTDVRLREVCMGVWEGRSWGDVMHDDPVQYSNFSNDPANWQVEGGESWDHLQHRIYDAILDIAARHDGQTIAIVSHGTAIRALMCLLQGVGSSDIHTVRHGDNTCVTLLDVTKDGMEVEYACDNSHLSDELSTFSKQTWWRTGTDLGNLRFRPLDFETESKFYLRCYEDAWRTSHGDTEGFVPGLYLISAKRWQAENPGAVAVALEDDTPVGIIALDTQRGADEGKGWIGFFYLLPEQRGKRYASQLLGYATTLFTNLGRQAVCLHVSEDNLHAQGFYRHTGFVQVGETVGVGAPLLLMEKDLGRGRLPMPAEET